MATRYAHISSLLSPEQMSDLLKVRDALAEDPMCLEHHKAHVGDKTRTIPVEDKNVQPE